MAADRCERKRDRKAGDDGEMIIDHVGAGTNSRVGSAPARSVVDFCEPLTSIDSCIVANVYPNFLRDFTFSYKSFHSRKRSLVIIGAKYAAKILLDPAIIRLYNKKL